MNARTARDSTIRSLVSCVGVGDSGDVLFDDRTLVAAGRHEVRRRPDDLDATLMR